MLEALRTTLKAIQAMLNKCVKKVNGLTPDADGNVQIGWQELADKPFGEEIVTLVDNQTITLEDGQGTVSYAMEFIEGQEYIVLYNGVVYRSTAVPMTVEGIGSGMAVGNASVFGGENTGEPFLMGSADGMTMIIAIDGSSEVVLTVISEGIKKIDAKYLPESPFVYYYTEPIVGDDCYIYADEARTRKVTASELLAVKDVVKIKHTYEVYKSGTNKKVPITVYVTPIEVQDWTQPAGYAMCNIPYVVADSGTPIYLALYTAEYTGSEEEEE